MSNEIKIPNINQNYINLSEKRPATAYINTNLNISNKNKIIRKVYSGHKPLTKK